MLPKRELIMSKQIIALYEDYSAASLAVENLATTVGVANDDISVLLNDSAKGKHFDIEVNTKAPEGTTAGVVAGGTLGAVAAGLAAVGVIAAPGIGLVAAGPILAALAGAGAGGAAGGLVGALVGAGFSEEEAKVASDGVENGNILIMVDAHENHVDKVKKVFENTGAKSVN